MPADNFVKFGDDPANKVEPYIKGDCSDEDHVDWCELRGAGFEIQQEKADDKNDQAKKAQEKNPTLAKVSLTKRVDWASTQLFQKCCQAGKAKINKDKDEKSDAIIDKVTVEICRTAGEKKFPFAIIEYSNVRITRFKINMNDPEPSETIEFEYDKFEFKYQPTNPETGKPDGPILTTAIIEGRKYTELEAGAAASDSSGAATGNAQAGANTTAAVAGGAVATSSGSRSVAALTSSVDSAISANFPGALPANGLSLLPD